MKLKCPKEGAQSIVEFLPPPEIRTRFLKVFIAQYHQSVNQKRQKIQYTIYLAGMVLSVPEIVFQVVSTILEDIVMLILYLPPRTGAAYQQPDILLGYQFVRYPTVFVDYFPLLPVIRLNTEVIYPEFFPFSTVFNAVYPPVPVFKMAPPVPFAHNKHFRLAPLDLFCYPGV
ncbi:MAG: hypothetical protein LBC51_00140 [Treponema sp.]|nr:hypothetical protein [Treponema sp.]